MFSYGYELYDVYNYYNYGVLGRLITFDIYHDMNLTGVCIRTEKDQFWLHNFDEGFN